MKLKSIWILTWACLLGRLQASALQTREELVITTPPDCAATCLVTLVPQFCDSFTDLICICTNANLTAAITTCALSACNVTESLELLNYKDRTCGVKNDKSHQNQDMRLHIVLTPLVGIFILARVFIRLRLETSLGLDDWAIVVAGIFYMGSAGIAFPITIMGYGQHTWYLPTSTIILSLKFFYVSEIFYGLVLTFTKLSLLLFFRRIFPNKKFQIATVVVGAFVVSSNLAIIVAMMTQCLPVHGNWTNWMYKSPPVKCVDSFVLIVFFAAISIFHDLVIMLMPLPILWGLNLHWKRKAHAMIMFSVGIFVVICSSLRVPILLKMKHTMDPSYDQAPVALWSYLEQAVGIICSCLPSFASLLVFLFPKLRRNLGSTGDGGPRSGSYGSANKSFHSRSDTHQSNFNRAEVELGWRGTSQEQIVDRGSRSSDESDHFRLVPVHKSGDRIGTRSTVTAVDGDKPRERSLFSNCPKAEKHNSRGEINVTSTVHVKK